MHEELVNDLPYIAAASQPVRGGQVIHIYRSVMLEDKDDLVWQVRKRFADRCHEKAVESIEEDSDMIGGQAVSTAYYVWNSCPGSRAAHHCVAASSG
ncbi:hypothetical protein [Amycolatopsis cihanbeyliensis]|uniref:hypothetical protein n=1 Tax=Amycolatopsis cihanbeyliensis TaxID=1128664 RepID=UPI001151A5B4|nr:hypothetical protein [Amycolatopsis cihanbeyliensis]